MMMIFLKQEKRSEGNREISEKEERHKNERAERRERERERK